MYSLEELRLALDRLDGEPADALESETLEFKSWNPRGSARREQVREFRETVVAFANANGGLLVLGVADRKRTRADAIHGVGDLDANSLRRDIYDGTEPHILVDVDELDEPEGRIIILRVPRGLPPHTTTDGVAKIRIGKDSKPLTGSTLRHILVTRSGYDMTAQPVSGARREDLDPEQIRRLRQVVSAEGDRKGLAGLGDAELLDALGLTSGTDVTLAAVLLVGSRSALARFAPQHELIFTRGTGQTAYDARQDMRGPILEVLDGALRLISAHVRLTTVSAEGFRVLELPDITQWVAREAVLNAIVHRDYFLNQSIHLNFRSGYVEIASPGGFIGGVTAENVLRHAPVRRNPLLADAMQAIGLVERAGLGVDRIYEIMLTLGKDTPKYEADEANVRLILPTETHEGFARFVDEMRRRDERLELNDLMTLRSLMNRRSVDRWSAAEMLQLPENEAASNLISLRSRGFLVAEGRGRGTIYRLARRYAALMQREPTEDEIWLDNEAVRLRIVAILTERDSITNAEIRRISGFSRAQVIALMRSLRDEGIVEVRGRGRAAHYILADGSATGDAG